MEIYADATCKNIMLVIDNQYILIKPDISRSIAVNCKVPEALDYIRNFNMIKLH